MSKIVLWIVVVLIALAALAVYYSRKSSERLDVAPDARREIEKAKRR